MPADEKWKANMEKVAFLKAFPGFLHNWEARGENGRSRDAAQEQGGGGSRGLYRRLIDRRPGADGRTVRIRRGPASSRRYLEPKHREAYAGYDQLVKKDKDAQRSARLENILGAIRNNMEQIPELKDRLKELVKEWK